MTAMSRVRRQAILRQATGSIELAELLVEAGRPLPDSAVRLLERALRTLDELPEPTRSQAKARLLEGEALRGARPLAGGDPAADGGYRTGSAAAGGLARARLVPEASGTARRRDRDSPQGAGCAPDQPIFHYNLSCYLSLDGDVQAAIEHLTRAISMDGRFRDLTEVEPDFDPIRADPRFVAVTTVTV